MINITTASNMTSKDIYNNKLTITTYQILQFTFKNYNNYSLNLFMNIQSINNLPQQKQYIAER
ncbi:hypothetical protein pb186bvf_017185 [Paramecium bursaria]